MATFVQFIKGLHVSNIIAIMVIIGCFSYFFYISSTKLPADQVHTISDIKTGMISLVTMVCGYYFGSSKSSATKDESVNKLIDNQTK